MRVKLFNCLIVVSATLIPGLLPFSALAHSRTPLGPTYTMIEDNGQWSGNCTNLRLNTYKCEMEKFTSGENLVYTVQVSIAGKRVLIRRTESSSSDSNGCIYRGNLDDSGHIQGTYKCKNIGDNERRWEAYLQNLSVPRVISF